MSTQTPKQELIHLVQSRLEAANDVRRGVCLLNAGRWDEAAVTFSNAANKGSTDRSLPAFLAACWIGQGDPSRAAQTLAGAVEAEDSIVADQIRHALALWTAGQQEGALASLREWIRRTPECAELHFQLGTLLTRIERYDEAELRFTQALNLDPEHTESMVSLALCCGVRRATTDALSHLRRAQARRPYDARIGLLLAQAAKAVRQEGLAVHLHAEIDVDSGADPQGIEELSCVIEADPDFVDAFLSIPADQVDEQVFAMLLQTLERALERQPEHAELHYHCGRVQDRLGRRQSAIDANERAVEIDPTFTRALIELGRLYQRTDRTADAASRLEQAIAAGADYADVYVLLGNLYRDRGEVGRARSAYRQALTINGRYQEARQALAALSAS